MGRLPARGWADQGEAEDLAGAVFPRGGRSPGELAAVKPESFDVIVVGGGNAGFSAALAAQESLPGGARILVIDKAPENWAGGNTFFTAGATRMTYDSLAELVPL